MYLELRQQAYELCSLASPAVLLQALQSTSHRAQLPGAQLLEVEGPSLVPLACRLFARSKHLNL